MTATEQSGTVLDWLQDIEANHYLTTSSSNTTPADDSETFYIVWGGQGDEDYVLTATPGSNNMAVAAGYNANSTQTDGGDFEDQVYSKSNADPPQSYDDSVDYYYGSGADWFWTVAKGDFNQNQYIAMGWQTVSTYWDYTFSHQALREALFAKTDDDFNDGWNDEQTAFCQIDDQQRLDGQLLNDRQDTLQPQIGSLTQANTWRTTDRTPILKADGGPALVGEIDAWGVDPAPDARLPDHLDDFDTGSGIYQYIWPRTDLWDNSVFFKVG